MSENEDCGINRDICGWFPADVYLLSLPARLVEVTCYGSQISLYDVEMAVPSVLKPDLIDV